MRAGRQEGGLGGSVLICLFGLVLCLSVGAHGLVQKSLPRGVLEVCNIVVSGWPTDHKAVLRLLSQNSTVTVYEAKSEEKYSLKKRTKPVFKPPDPKMGKQKTQFPRALLSIECCRPLG